MDDPFGIEELERELNKVEGRFDNFADAFLAAETRRAKKIVKQRTARSNKQHKGGKDKPLKQTWSEKKPKDYQNGKYKVSMIYSKASHAHLYELGHEMVTRTRTRAVGGRFQKEAQRMGKVKKLDSVGKIKYGVKKHGFVVGRSVLAGTLKEAEAKWGKAAEQALDKALKAGGL